MGWKLGMVQVVQVQVQGTGAGAGYRCRCRRDLHKQPSASSGIACST